ncbi:seven-hairpin glycosidase [Ascobolus immersus RN42]|uniref:alpha-1,2-Mannosidase n=1 Tax=Ascobolus immersus RN42 TaxID=1160509 RepID=A0A3N4HSZ3_ASCIM|nr:seven-hairpin glycosidase [Ascobolus immersus RN42]
MRLFDTVIPFLLAANVVSASATAAAALTAPPAIPTTNSARKAAVVAAFQHSWDGYTKHAWGHDDLRPISNRYADTRNRWGATIIDSMSTAILMGLDEVLLKQVEWVKTVNFTTTEKGGAVSLFETTIRYIGGLLSAHDLLSGPYSHLIPDKAERAETLALLVQQTETLADTLIYGFDTPSGIPHNNLYIRKKTWSGRDPSGLAVAGTLILEWTRLRDVLVSKLPVEQPIPQKYQKYVDVTLRAQNHLMNPVPASSEPFPGLVGAKIDVATGQFLDAFGGWSGSTDSYYEYLLKSALYTPEYRSFGNTWLKAVDSTLQHLIMHPQGYDDIWMVAEYNGTKILPRMGHLTCFIGGNLMLGGWHYGNATISKAGEKLTEGCRWAYKSSETGLGGEGWKVDGTVQYGGISVTNADYILRPEVIESYYYGLVFTGEEKYRDWAWEAFQSIEKYCKTGSGYMGLKDVNDVTERREGIDHMESFFLAETLKYLFLIFEWGEGQKIDMREGWVFNTEAHPFRVQAGDIANRGKEDGPVAKQAKESSARSISVSSSTVALLAFGALLVSAV